MLTQRSATRQPLSRRWSNVLTLAALAALLFVSVASILINALPGAAPTASARSAPAGERPLAAAAATQGTYTLYLPVVRAQPSAQQLIAEALDDGRIDYGTSLVYRAYAMFGDPRLPVAFRGAGSSGFEAALYYEAQDPALSAAVKAQLRPFLTRPDNPDSVFNTQPASRAATRAPAAGLACNAQNWASRQSQKAGVLAKVHVKCTNDPAKDEQELSRTLEIIELIWGPLTGPMGQPTPDSGGNDGGGSTAIDFYLVAPISDVIVRNTYSYTTTAPGATWALSPTLDTSSSIVLLNRQWVSNVIDYPYQFIVAHEFFHVLQNSRTPRFAFKKDVEWWFTEASAVWAETYVESAVSWPDLFWPGSTHARFTEFLQSDESLHTSAAAKDTAKVRHMYAAYIWPFFMEQETGGTEGNRSASAMAAIWKELSTIKDGDWNKGLAAIDRQLPFADHFHDFAVRNMNIDFETDSEALKKRYQQLDSFFPNTNASRPPMRVERINAEQLVPEAARQPVIGDVLPALSARYYHFQIAPEHGGIQTRRVIFDFSDIAKPGLGIDAVIKYANGPDKSWKLEHWSGRTKVEFCFEQPDERISEIYLVLSNAAIEPTNTIAGVVWASVLQEPCDCTQGEVVAQTGGQDFTALGEGVSINDVDQVAFVGSRGASGDAVYVAGRDSQPQQIRGLLSQPGRSYMPAVQISSGEPPQVVARAEKQSEGVTQLWRFDAQGENNSLNVIAAGRAGSATADFDEIATHPAINASGQMAFVAIAKGQRVLVTADKAKQFTQPARLAPAAAAPMIADDGQVVVYDALPNGSPAIRLYPFSLGAPADIACPPGAACAHPGFTRLGGRPGISDDGRIVSFYGEVAAGSADALHTYPGPGIFVSIANGDSRRLVRIAGSDSGFSGFDANARAATTGILGPRETITLVYLATDLQGRKGIFAQRLPYPTLQTPDDARVTKPDQPILVALSGLRVCGLTGAVRSLALDDPINDAGFGTVAFWVETASNEQAIVRLGLPPIGNQTPTPTPTASSTATSTTTSTTPPTAIPTATATATADAVWTATPTATSTGTTTTSTPTPTDIATNTPTILPTNTPTVTDMPTATITPTPTSTSGTPPTRTRTPSITPTPTNAPREVRWVSPSSGAWQTPANWSTGQVPGPDDNVIIDVTSAITVTYNGPASSIRSLHSQESLTIASGSLAIGAASAIAGDLSLNGPLTVQGDLDVGGKLYWNGWSMGGPGTTHARGGFVVDGNSSFRQLQGRTLANYGPAAINRGLVSGDSASAFENRAGATLDMGGDVQLSAGVIRNDGTILRSAGAGEAILTGQLLNSGTIEARTGQLRLDIRGAGAGGGSILGAPGTELRFLISGSLEIGATGRIAGSFVTVNGNGQLTVLGGYNVSEGTSILNGATRFGPGASIASLGRDVSLAGGTLDLSTGAPVQATVIKQSGGVLTGADTLTVNEWFEWNGGIWEGPGAVIIAQELDAGGQTPQVAHRSTGRSLENRGTATWHQGYFSFEQGARFLNTANGILNIQGDNSFSGPFVNAGLLRKFSAGITQFNREFSNSGAADIQAGTLFVYPLVASTQTGSFTGAPGTTLEWRTSDAAKLTTFSPQSRLAVPTLVVQGAGQGFELRVEGTYVVERTVLQKGELSFHTAGPATLPNGRVEGGTLIAASDIIVSGALDWVGSGSELGGEGKLVIQGQMLIEVPHLVGGGTATLATTLENRGTITWRSGFIAVTAGGVLDNKAGALFEAQGDQRITGNPYGAGLFRNEGTVRKNGAAGASTLALPFTGSGTVDARAGLLELQGSGPNTMRFIGTASGTLRFRGDQYAVILEPGSRVEAPNVEFVNGNVVVRGTYNVATSTNVNGAVTFDAGAQLTDMGATVTLDRGEATFATGGPVHIRSLVMKPAGNLRGPSEIVVDGQLTWQGGVMYGPGRTIARGGISLVGATQYTYNVYDYTQGLIGRTLVNEGAATCDGCLIYADQGAVFENAATASFQTTRDAAFARCTVNIYNEFGQAKQECIQQGTMPVFRNAGSLVVAGPGTLYFSAVPNVPAPPSVQAARPFPAQLANSGTVRVAGGGLNVAGGYTQTGGALMLAGGSLAGSTLDIQGGSLSGAGTITGAVVNGGTFQPGGSGAAGTIAIAGTYRQLAAGRLEIELGGLVAGTQFDRLTVSGQASLGGTLAVGAINGFAPPAGNAFAVLAYGSRAGVFATVSGAGYTVDYGQQSANLVAP